jgi:hypothetical protein
LIELKQFLGAVAMDMSFSVFGFVPQNRSPALARLSIVRNLHKVKTDRDLGAAETV